MKRCKTKYMNIWDWMSEDNGSTSEQPAPEKAEAPATPKRTVRRPRKKKEEPVKVERPGFFVKRINVTAGEDITIIGKKFVCGPKAESYDSVKSARAAMKSQLNQDNELCPDHIIRYEIIDRNGTVIEQEKKWKTEVLKVKGKDGTWKVKL
jgi:hypothetical protein